jgi:hypothetical protein
VWQDLVAELDRWSHAGEVATLWWRDDDAVAPTRELELLLQHARTVPLAMAVMPGLSTAALVDRLRVVPAAVVLQHGWTHTNHATARKSEYPSSRTAEDVSAEIQAGRRVLLEQFGARALPVFAPPWHHIDDVFLPILARHGLSHISRDGPRTGPFAVDGLRQVNTHASSLTWPLRDSSRDEERCVSEIVQHLSGRRTGRYDPREPTGFLTHHLAQPEGSYEWIARLTELTLQHPAARWLAGPDVFGCDGP